MIIKQQRHQHNTHSHRQKMPLGLWQQCGRYSPYHLPLPPLKHTLLAIIKSKQITCYPIYGYIFRALIPSHFIPLDCWCCMSFGCYLISDCLPLPAAFHPPCWLHRVRPLLVLIFLWPAARNCFFMNLTHLLFATVSVCLFWLFFSHLLLSLPSPFCAATAAGGVFLPFSPLSLCLSVLSVASEN